MALAAKARPPLRFVDRSGLTGLLLKNMGLNLVTLGFYRFWARTGLRRHLWSRITIDGDALEYTGTGGELFKGFLVVLAVLAPVLTAVTVAEAMLAMPPPIAKGVEFLVFGGLGFLAVFRARRYRLSRTSWRGIRFAQDGSAWTYVVGSLLWMVAIGLSFGLAVPWWRIWDRRLLINSTCFGDRRFECDARTWPVVGHWLLVLATLGLAYPWYRVCEFKYLVAHTRLGTTAASSQLWTSIIYRQVLLFVIVLALIGGATFALTHDLLTSPALVRSLGSAAALKFVPAVLVVAVIVRPLLVWPMLYVPILRHALGTLRVKGIDEINDTARSKAIRPASGEGLADAFDTGTEGAFGFD